MRLSVSLDVLLLQVAIAFGLSVWIVCSHSQTPTTPGSPIKGLGAALGVHLAAACAVTMMTGNRLAACAGVVAGLLAFLPLLKSLRRFTMVGRLLLSTQIELMAVGTAWGVSYVLSLPVSTETHALMVGGLPLMAITIPLGLLGMIPQWDVLCRYDWRRPRAALQHSSRRTCPKVSLHVPICSEPPDVVIATLEALARMEYPSFEVLVIDNNTHDEWLWRPVEHWCRADARFRFFHLESCPGAKAGALNFALPRTDPDAVIIGLIDSDYQARPTFLSALVGYFEDPRVGFVQSPHDYREWEHSLYQRMCYWEYRVFFSTTMASWNERGAAITVGTMALIRRQALEQAGGWSEWCLTEDSELAPRIHALGYTSVYVGETFGRGLIPETFAGYAKQRRRWTYGPIQELKRHLPMLVPSRLGVQTALTPVQKLFHLHHDLDPLFTGLGLLLLPWGLVLLASMLVNGERPTLPTVVWVASAVVALASQAMTWSVQRRAMGCSFVDFLCASIAKCALAHSIMVSALRALFGIPLSWQRTDKFKAQVQGARRAMTSARVELALGLTLLTVGVAGLCMGTRGLLLCLFLGVLLQGVGYLTAPFVALLAEWDLWRGTTGQSEDIVEEAEAAA
jgi:cellulose synthase/poly-beta-1,6-N-acetylglucosamine synthase-like glycosyltransferase